MAQNLYSPFQCNVCLMLEVYQDSGSQNITSEAPSKKFSDLLTCAGCNLANYCNKSHQKIDWPLHADLCTAIQKIKKKLQISHPLLIRDQQPPKSYSDIELIIIKLKYLITCILKRPLEHHEEEITSHLQFCPICYSYKNLKFLCLECKSQTYCSAEHLEAHRVEHMKICDTLDLYYTPYKTLPLAEDFELSLKQNVENFQNCDLVQAFESAFECKLSAKPTRSREDYQLFAYASSFSCIFTICYGLCQLDMTAYKSSRFVIFIVGASMEAQLWFKAIHCQFFFHQYSQIQELDLYFIGPEVVEPPYNIIKFQYKGIQRTVNFHCHKEYFQNFRQHNSMKAQLIVAFNCGFSEYSRESDSESASNCESELEQQKQLEKDDTIKSDTWYFGLLEILNSFSSLVIFTSFTKLEAGFDFAALTNVCQIQPLKVSIERVIAISQNPFRDLRPHRHWYENDHERIFYRNGYIQAITTKIE
uniref:MYND-type domain-containing protein n=1 Tax=Stomoxys calcitrans TaxID=35570 RepID=A0A1I8PQW9_STOCA